MLFKKEVAFTIIILFIGISIFPSVGSTVIEKSNLSKYFEDRVTIYYADALIEYSKFITGPYIVFDKHIHFSSREFFLNFDANLESLSLKIVVNYTAEMNFTAGFPYVIFAPIIAFGLIIENYSDYVWKSFKLKHDGYAKQEGNVSIEIPFDMNNIKSGDKFLLVPKVAIVGDPQVYESKDLQFSKFTSLLLRLAYHVPPLNKTLLEKLLLPFIAEHDSFGIYGDFTKIYILFE